MESAKCNVIYVHRAVSEDRHVQSSHDLSGSGVSGSLEDNVRLISSAFESGRQTTPMIVSSCELC